jgi:hypothetical protein
VRAASRLSAAAIIYMYRYVSLAIIGGDPARFKPYAELYHRAFAKLERPVRDIGVHSPGYVADTDAQAHDELWQPELERRRHG